VHLECPKNKKKKTLLHTETVKKGIIIPPGTTNFLIRNPPEEWNSTGNYWLLNNEFTRVIDY
jgi:hypothetical protein